MSIYFHSIYLQINNLSVDELAERMEQYGALLEEGWKESEAQFLSHQNRLKHLDTQMYTITGRLKAILTRAATKMTAHELNATSCLEQLEAHVQRLTGTLDEVCATVGLPADCGLMTHPRPCLDEQPGMKIRWLGRRSQGAGEDKGAGEKAKDGAEKAKDECAKEGAKEGSAERKSAGDKSDQSAGQESASQASAGADANDEDGNEPQSEVAPSPLPSVSPEPSSASTPATQAMTDNQFTQPAVRLTHATPSNSQESKASSLTLITKPLAIPTVHEEVPAPPESQEMAEMQAVATMVVDIDESLDPSKFILSVTLQN